MMHGIYLRLVTLQRQVERRRLTRAVQRVDVDAGVEQRFQCLAAADAGGDVYSPVASSVVQHNTHVNISICSFTYY